MKTILKKLSIAMTAVAVMACMAPRMALAQAQTGTVQGHAQNPLGIPFPGGTVKLSTDHTSTNDATRKYDFTGTVDAQGNYKIAGVTPGTTWIAFLFDTKNQLVDYINNFTVKPDQTAVVDFDMTRKEYIDRMTPAEKAQMEDYRKKNEGVVAANAKIANLNAMLTKARTEIKDNPDDAVQIMTQATQAKPDEPILWLTLAQAEQYDGDAFFAKTHKMTDDDVQKHYHAAIDDYKKGLDLELAKKTPSPTDLGAGYNGLGTVNGKLGNTTEAVADYDNAAKALPTSAGTYYYNAAATFYNGQKMDEAAAAADKAIAADPTKPEPYYIKGQALIGKASVDPQTQKITAPPGCVEAYNKYLQLAPTGPHAEEIKGILQGIGQTVNSSYGSKPSSSKKK